MSKWFQLGKGHRYLLATEMYVCCGIILIENNGGFEILNEFKNLKIHSHMN
jgi:hypothetical protein